MFTKLISLLLLVCLAGNCVSLPIREEANNNQSNQPEKQNFKSVLNNESEALMNAEQSQQTKDQISKKEGNSLDKSKVSSSVAENSEPVKQEVGTVKEDTQEIKETQNTILDKITPRAPTKISDPEASTSDSVEETEDKNIQETEEQKEEKEEQESMELSSLLDATKELDSILSESEEDKLDIIKKEDNIKMARDAKLLAEAAISADNYLKLLKSRLESMRSTRDYYYYGY